MRRLFRCQVELIYQNKHGERSVASRIADSTELWWNERKPDQSAVWASKIEFGEKFFREVIADPVPLDMNILKAMKRAPLGLDLYLWLTYRTFSLKRPLRLTWGSSTGSSALTRPRPPTKAPLIISARIVCASCRRSSARGGTCTTRRSRGALLVSPSPPAIATSQLRLVDAG